jgi:hypothetical protein
LLLPPLSILKNPGKAYALGALPVVVALQQSDVKIDFRRGLGIFIHCAVKWFYFKTVVRFVTQNAF